MRALVKRLSARLLARGERSTRLSPEPGSNKSLQTVDSIEAEKSRGELRLLYLEREILGSALATIIDSRNMGLLSREEAERLSSKYKVDLSRLEEQVVTHQRIVDLHELEKERQEFINTFKRRLDEIDAKITELRSSAIATPGWERAALASYIQLKPDSPSSQQEDADRGRRADNAEKRVEAIRDEVLKAIEKLEELDSEG